MVMNVTAGELWVMAPARVPQAKPEKRLSASLLASIRSRGPTTAFRFSESSHIPKNSKPNAAQDAAQHFKHIVIEPPVNIRKYETRRHYQSPTRDIQPAAASFDKLRISGVVPLMVSLSNHRLGMSHPPRPPTAPPAGCVPGALR